MKTEPCLGCAAVVPAGLATGARGYCGSCYSRVMRLERLLERENVAAGRTPDWAADTRCRSVGHETRPAARMGWQRYSARVWVPLCAACVARGPSDARSVLVAWRELGRNPLRLDARPAPAGWLWLSDYARRHGVALLTARGWVARGLVAAEQDMDCAGRWRVREDAPPPPTSVRGRPRGRRESARTDASGDAAS